MVWIISWSRPCLKWVPECSTWIPLCEGLEKRKNRFVGRYQLIRKSKRQQRSPPKTYIFTESRDFLPLILCTKDSTWATQEQAKTVSLNFSFSRRNSLIKFENHVSRVRVVNNHAYTRFSRISSRKRKISRNCFLPVHMGPR